MRNCVRLSVAIVMLALQACSGDDEKDLRWPPGTCSPGAHTTADPSAAEAYCTAYFAEVCDRAFTDCGAELGTGGYASAAECRADYAAWCGILDFSNDWYDAGCGGACLDFIAGAPCSAFLGDEPQACSESTGLVPPTCVATIGAGTYSDTILVGDPMFDGGHSRTYCLPLTAGHSLTLATAAGLSGTPIGDTVLYLLDPNGTVIAYDDDSGTGTYSLLYVSSLPATGTYRVVVAGYSSGYVGSFQLLVTAP